MQSCWTATLRKVITDPDNAWLAMYMGPTVR